VEKREFSNADKIYYFTMTSMGYTEFYSRVGLKYFNFPDPRIWIIKEGDFSINITNTI